MTQEAEKIRLNKYLALQQGISRREADDLIAKGQVTIDGKVAALGARLSPSSRIEVKGEPLSTIATTEYILFNKPAGYVCSRRKQGDNDTIYSILPSHFHHLKPVGRLDKDSSGLLLLSNDGDFTYRMTHPSFHKQKTYLVSLDIELEPLHQQMINDYGVQLEDGVSKLTLERQSESNRSDWIVMMHEGRNRQIRRTFSALGYTVTKLHRTHFGNYSLGDIKSGEYKPVNMQ